MIYAFVTTKAAPEPKFSVFPEAGPTDGNLASGGNVNYTELDEQSPTRWYKTDLKTGPTTFTWYLTAAHRTTNWRFFITKTDWDQSAPLTRASFDLTSFCQRDDDSAIPQLSNTY